jgi:hypothetical protein
MCSAINNLEPSTNREVRSLEACDDFTSIRSLVNVMGTGRKDVRHNARGVFPLLNFADTSASKLVHGNVLLSNSTWRIGCIKFKHVQVDHCDVCRNVTHQDTFEIEVWGHLPSTSRDSCWAACKKAWTWSFAFVRQYPCTNGVFALSKGVNQEELELR